MVLIAESEAMLRKLFNAFERFCTQNNLFINAKKTEVMIIKGKSSKAMVKQPRYFRIGKYSFLMNPQFKYLGCMFDTKASSRCMVEHIVVKGKQALGSLV